MIERHMIQVPERRALRLSTVFVFVAAFVLYWLTAYRTVTWWDNCQYSAAAAVLGVTVPPGSLLATLLGWIAIHVIPFGSTVFRLNLLACFLAALTSALVLTVSLKMLRSMSGSNAPARGQLSATLLPLTIGISVLTLAVGVTLWNYATRFTPYVLTAVFTTLILWALLRWWDKAEHGNAVEWLFVIGLLFGLDFCVHRTNLLLLPGAVVWVLVRRPVVLKSVRPALAVLVGLILGAGVHLLTLLLASNHPALNMGNPSTWSGFVDYITLKQFGGGMLIDLFPRKGPFWSYQVIDYLKVFASNFFTYDSPLGVLGVLPSILGVFGAASMWRSSRRLGIGFMILFLLSSFGAIVYFNVPENFFRSMDRHYLPSLVIFTVWIAYGCGVLVSLAGNLSTQYRRIATAVVAACVLGTAVNQVWRNWKSLDSSRKSFTHDYAVNVFTGLPSDAILFTSGDNDTFPLWYLQMVEEVRPDVSVVNLPLLNTSWYGRQVASLRPEIPLGLTGDQIDSLGLIPWKDSTIVLPVAKQTSGFGLGDSVTIPASLSLEISPDIADQYMSVARQLLLRIVEQNQWRRPIYFSSGAEQYFAPWMQPFLRNEGFASRVMPVASLPVNADLLRENLLTKYRYDGYNDPSVHLDDVSRQMVFNAYVGALTLAGFEQQYGHPEECRNVVDQIKKRLPPERVLPPPPLAQGLDHICSN